MQQEIDFFRLSLTFSSLQLPISKVSSLLKKNHLLNKRVVLLFLTSFSSSLKIVQSQRRNQNQSPEQMFFFYISDDEHLLKDFYKTSTSLVCVCWPLYWLSGCIMGFCLHFLTEMISICFFYPSSYFPFIPFHPFLLFYAVS